MPELPPRVEPNWSLTCSTTNPVNLVAAAAGVYSRTVRTWVARYQAESPASLSDGSSRPARQRRGHAGSHRRPYHRVAPPAPAGDPDCADRGVSPATVSRVLRRAGLHRLDPLEPAPPVRRYERADPGELLHLDVKKLARFQQPDHRVTGNRRQCTPGAGWDDVQVCVDDRSRVGFAQLYPDETAPVSPTSSRPSSPTSASLASTSWV